jgi:hypothetical protein
MKQVCSTVFFHSRQKQVFCWQGNSLVCQVETSPKILSVYRSNPVTTIYNISAVVGGDMVCRIVKIYSNLECAFQIFVTVHTISPPTYSSGVNITGVFISMQCCRWTLTLNPLMWKIRWAPNNASKRQMGFNLAFKGLIMCIVFSVARHRWGLQHLQVRRFVFLWCQAC